MQNSNNSCNSLKRKEIVSSYFKPKEDKKRNDDNAKAIWLDFCGNTTNPNQKYCNCINCGISIYIESKHLKAIEHLKCCAPFIEKINK